jgi:type II restriction enzyme
MNLEIALAALKNVISKSRAHLYKPIQIAEILYHHRKRDIRDLTDLESYRSKSKAWRDNVSRELVGHVCTSSSKFQDHLFEKTAIPPRLLHFLGQENLKQCGIVEAYIYYNLMIRFSQISDGLLYCTNHDRSSFSVQRFINLFWEKPGLRRSVDKIYEIVVYALFSTLIDVLNVTVKVTMAQDQKDVLVEFQDFANKVMQINLENFDISMPAKLNRLGVTNASDSGLDMWANFGVAVQVKHLNLDEEGVEKVVQQITADRIIVVCKDIEKKIIASLINQIGWKSRIQSIVTESDLIQWYEKALRGKYGTSIGDALLQVIIEEMHREFPSMENDRIKSFMRDRNYCVKDVKNWMDRLGLTVDK